MRPATQGEIMLRDLAIRILNERGIDITRFEAPVRRQRSHYQPPQLGPEAGLGVRDPLGRQETRDTDALPCCRVVGGTAQTARDQTQDRGGVKNIRRP